MQIGFYELGIFLLWLPITGLAWIPIWVLLDILTPKVMLERYFKKPHFTGGELFALNLFPGSLMRVSIFGWGLWFPSLGKKRQLCNLSEGTPRWYAVALKIFIAGSMIHGLLFIGLLIGMLVYVEFFE